MKHPVKPNPYRQWIVLGLPGGAACLLGALCLPACGGSSFTADNPSAGSGGEPGSAGSGTGGRGSGASGTGTGVGDSGAAGALGTAGDGGDGAGGDGGNDGDGGDGNSGRSGSGSGGSANTSGAPNATGGSAGAAQAGSAGAAGAPVKGVKAFDDFAASAEGWTVTGDDGTKTVKYSSTGGNLNGSVSAEETSTGTMFFTAPSKYLGNGSAYYGGELRFDLKAAASTGEFFSYADVELTSNLTTLAYDCTPNPTTAWQHYVVPLNETGWKVTTVTGAAVTAAQFQLVLANLTRVRIRAEFTNGSDIGYLDNVYFGSK